MTLGVGIAIAAITVFADYLLKLAALGNGFFGWRFLIVGAIIYACTALGWFYLMRETTLSNIAIIYSMSSIILLFGLSVLVFSERFEWRDALGFCFAVAAILLMSRYI